MLFAFMPRSRSMVKRPVSGYPNTQKRTRWQILRSAILLSYRVKQLSGINFPEDGAEAKEIPRILRARTSISGMGCSENASHVISSGLHHCSRGSNS